MTQRNRPFHHFKKRKPATVNDIFTALSGRNYALISCEADLQKQVEARLAKAKIEYAAQVQLDSTSKDDRIDVVCDSIGLELKVKGGTSSVLSQLERYAQSPLVTDLLLVTTKAAHMNLRGIGSVHGKPLYVVLVGCL